MKNKLLLVLSSITLITIYLLMFIGKNFYIEFNMSKEDIILEYNQEYELNKPRASLLGKYILKEGYEIPVTSSDNIDNTKLGEYEITYHSKFMFWEDSAKTKVFVKDTTAPTITLKHIDDYYTLPNEEYMEEGYWANDNYDGDLTDKVKVEKTKEKITYTVVDSSGNITIQERKIFYNDPIAPELKLNGDETITLEEGNKYTEPGYNAIDNVDGDLTEKVKVETNLDTNKPGTYEIKYTISDNYNNKTEKTRKIIITAKPTPTPTPTPSAKPEVHNPTTPTEKVIYLTFDDGPSKYTPDLLKILDKYNVKATFFVVDTAYDYLIKDIYEAGHSIGLHTLTHEYSQIYKSEAAFYEDLYAIQDLVYKNTGTKPTLTRFPGGSSNSVSKKYCKGIMTKLTTSLPENGFRYFDWNVSSGDAGGTTTKDGVVSNVINGCKKKKTCVVLQHDTKKYSVEAVEEIIIWGLENGYTFLPLDINSPGMHHGVNN
jgi:peptidoglycan/xylan/chitin deacetylase (PgdA/CDA1 family)